MSLENLNRRIKTTQDIGDIVHTLKMLSSASLGQYEKSLKSLTHYGQTISDAFHGLFCQENFRYEEPQIKSKDSTPLIILIGSDNGMVGRFNHDLISFTETYFQTNYPNIHPYFITVGKKITMLSQAQKFNVLASYPISNSIKEIAPMAAQLLNQVNQIVSNHKIDFVYLFSNRRQGNSSFEPHFHQLIPLAKEHLRKLRKEKWIGRTLPLITSNQHALFSALIREYLIVLLSHDLVSSLASEHYTRMMHMQEAENNIQDRLDDFNLEYQQLRQTQVTDELMDIVSGAEEMNNKKNQPLLDFSLKKK